MEILNYSSPSTKNTSHKGGGITAYINALCLLAAGIEMLVIFTNDDIYARIGAFLLAGTVCIVQLFVTVVSIYLHPRHWWLPCSALAIWIANFGLVTVLPTRGGHC